MPGTFNEKPQDLAKVIEQLSAKLETQNQELNRLRSLIEAGSKRSKVTVKNTRRQLLATPKRFMISLPAKAVSLSFIVLMLFSTIAVASIPSSSGVITACYVTSKGDLRLIDPATTACKSNETQITWNQQGVPGPAGSSIRLVADMHGSNLPNVVLAGLLIGGVNFSNSNLSGADFYHSNLEGADFSDATLTNAVLYAVPLGGVHFVNTNLDGSNMRSAGGSNLDFTNASVKNVDLTGAILEQTNFTNANFTGAILTNAFLQLSTFQNTTCPDGTNSDNNGGTCVGHGFPPES